MVEAKIVENAVVVGCGVHGGSCSTTVDRSRDDMHWKTNGRL